MADAAVTFNGTRLDDSDTSTDWGNYNTTGGAPASEFPLAYQVTSGTTSGAVNKKVSSSVARQGIERYNATGADMTGTNKLWFCKVYISDSFDLNATWGVEVNVGSADNSNKHIYNIAGSGANLSVYSQYPAQGGYLITSIDPNIDTWPETIDSGGAFDQVNVRYFALGAQFINGTAKAENVALDSLDIGSGLTITNGDGVSTEGNFLNFVTTDQNIKANRWGVVTGSGDIVRAHGILTIGTATITEFLDTTSIILFPDGYHSRGLVGVAVGMSNASSIVNIGSLFIGEGTRNGVDANDTRPDFTVTGTSGTFDFSGTLRNFRDVTFTSICDVDGADIECHLLTQNSANISNSTIRTNSLTSIACLQAPTFGTTTDLHDCTFVQAGAGHAIELDTATTYSFSGLTFTGYGANTTDNAALDITATIGTVVIQVAGGSTPTYKTAGATVDIQVSVTVTFEAVDKLDQPIQGVRITAYLVSDDSEVINTLTNASGIASTTFGGTTPADIYYRYRKASVDPKYRALSGFGTIEPSTGLSIKRSMTIDTNNNT